MKDLFTPLGEPELTALDAFLADPVREATTMDVAMLEGYLVALAIGPETVMPSARLPWVWDIDAGTADAQFADLDEMEHIIQLVMRLYNQVLQQFEADPKGFDPVYWRSAGWGATEWCEGFLLGTRLCDDAWDSLMVDRPDWFAPFMRLGTDEGLAITEEEDDAEFWMNAVTPALAHLHGFWLERRQLPPSDLPASPVIRSSPKVGRNASCPWGAAKNTRNAAARVVIPCTDAIPTPATM
jgi:uncharacterized protein